MGYLSDRIVVRQDMVGRLILPLTSKATKLNLAVSAILATP